MPIDSPVESGFSVTPNDSTDLAHPTRGIYVGGTGNLSVILRGGDTVTFQNLVAGIIHPIQASRIRSTGTTATGIIAVY